MSVAIENLCREIGYLFEPDLENPRVLGHYVMVLVERLSAAMASHDDPYRDSNASPLAELFSDALCQVVGHIDRMTAAANAIKTIIDCLDRDDDGLPSCRWLYTIMECATAIDRGVADSARSRRLIDAGIAVASFVVDHGGLGNAEVEDARRSFIYDVLVEAIRLCRVRTP